MIVIEATIGGTLTFDEYIRSIGLSTDEVMVQIGIDRQSICRYRRRSVDPTLKQAIRLIEWAKGHVTPQELVKIPKEKRQKWIPPQRYIDEHFNVDLSVE